MLREQLADAIERVGRGDRTALREVYDRTSAKLLGVCLRVVGDRPTAEDVLQEVYLKIWRGATAFDSQRASPITWLCAIARNTAVDSRRASTRHADRVAELAEEAAIGGTGAAPPDAEVERDMVWHCLETIEPRQSRAIRLAFVDGFTYRELAESARVPLGTMKSWVRRGLLQLKECLGDG